MNMINQIVNGDAEQVLKGMKSETVDLVVTSPPYPIEEHLKEQKAAQYWGWLKKVLKECKRVLKPGGRMCVNFDNTFKDGEWQDNYSAMAELMRGGGMTFYTEIIWRKPRSPSRPAQIWGTKVNPQFQRMHEYILVFRKGKGDKHKTNRGITGRQFANFTQTVWTLGFGKHEIRRARRMRFSHAFPMQLPKRLIKLLSSRGDLVLDPFSGLGTTCVAAKMLGRNYTGIEKDQQRWMASTAWVDSIAGSEIKPEVKRLSDDVYQRITRVAKRGKWFSRKAIELPGDGKTNRSVSRVFRRLVEEGWLEKRGVKRTMEYRIRNTAVDREAVINNQ